jgi:hypothetical protein
MTKATKGNYENAAAGSFRNRATTPSGGNYTGTVRTGKLASELPTSKSYSTLTEAEKDRPNLDEIIASWR